VPISALHNSIAGASALDYWQTMMFDGGAKDPRTDPSSRSRKRRNAPPDLESVLHLSHSPLPDSTDLAALLHELNQPLTSILSNAQAAQRFLSNTLLDRAELYDILQDIIADDKRAATIIKRLGQALKEVESTMSLEAGAPR
jgi:signal transduction histidine kinase